ncbi:MAG: hypothetical protein QMD65_01690 [Patescibacteria group bacterium]|nr:hypothetical protein [Patescibacteria group bacterium]
MKYNLKQNLLENKRGFTLFEALLYLSLTAILFFTTSIFLSNLWQSRVRNEAISEVEQQGSIAMHKITQTVRNALNINLPTISTMTSVLSLTTVSSSLNPTIFSLSNNIL